MLPFALPLTNWIQGKHGTQGKVRENMVPREKSGKTWYPGKSQGKHGTQGKVSETENLRIMATLKIHIQKYSTMLNFNYEICLFYFFMIP